MATPVIADLPALVDERVVLHGWFVSLRRTKALRFLALRDRTGTVQAVHRGDHVPPEIDQLVPESAVRITGVVRKGQSPRYGPVEIDIESIDLLARADTPLPQGRANADTHPQYRHLDLRSREGALTFEVQTTMEAAMRRFLLERRFLEIHTPKITAGGSESGAAVFTLPYFGASACLVQSPQFYVQLAMAAGFDRAFEVGPVFRAEPADTNRHATEFTCIDIELSWIDSHDDLMTFEEELLHDALTCVRREHGRAIERCFGVDVEVPIRPIPRIPFAQARELTGHAADNDGGKMTYSAEHALSRYAREQYGQSFVFVTDFPASERPFYTMRSEASDTITRSFDLLWRGLEVTSGCQREHRYDRLRTQIAESGMQTDTMSRYLETHYLEMFRYGCPPHGGFGIGINRLLMMLLARPSIRETSFVFRGPGRFVP